VRASAVRNDPLSDGSGLHSPSVVLSIAVALGARPQPLELELLAAHRPQRRLAAHEARKLEADVRGPRAIAV
jgi:hypothetical protein